MILEASATWPTYTYLKTSTCVLDVVRRGNGQFLIGIWKQVLFVSRQDEKKKCFQSFQAIGSQRCKQTLFILWSPQGDEPKKIVKTAYNPACHPLS